MSAANAVAGPVVAVVDDEEHFFDARSRTPSVELDELALSGSSGVSGRPGDDQPAAPLTPEERALLVERVRALIDFYFGDANFSKDQFLRKHASSDPQGEGWISVELVGSFKKMKLLTNDASVVLDAMKKSDVIMLNSTQDKLKRKEPMENFIEDVLARTIHISIPRDASEGALKELCSPFGEIARLRVLDPTCDPLPVEIATHCVDEQGHPRFRQLPGMLSAFVQYGSIKQAGVASRALNAKKDWRYPVHVDLIYVKAKNPTSGNASPAHSREGSPYMAQRFRSSSFHTNSSSGHHSPLAFDASSIPTVTASSAAAATAAVAHVSHPHPHHSSSGGSPTSTAAGSPSRPRSSSFNVRRGSPGSSDHSYAHAASAESPTSSMAGGLSPGARRRYLVPTSGSMPSMLPTGRSGLSQVESPEAWRRDPAARTQAVMRNPTGPTGGRGFAVRHGVTAAGGSACPW